MRLLLDTHVLLWSLLGSRRLGPATRRRLEDPANDCYVSAASTWEIAIKAGLGKSLPEFDLESLEEVIVAAGFRPLPVTLAHSLVIDGSDLPQGDPFDRLLLAQCHVETLRLLTADRNLLVSPLAIAA